jgi:hypothetical protein
MANRLEAIDVEMAQLREQKESAQSKLRTLSAERDELIARESAARKILAMSAAERKVLGIPEPQIVQPESIESGEAVGEPGK